MYNYSEVVSLVLLLRYHPNPFTQFLNLVYSIHNHYYILPLIIDIAEYLARLIIPINQFQGNNFASEADQIVENVSLFLTLIQYTQETLT